VNPDDVSERIDKIQAELMSFTRLFENSVYSLESKIEVQVHCFQELTENKVAGQLLTLTSHITTLQLSAEYHLARA